MLAALELITEDQGLHPELADLLEARVSEVLDVGVALDLYRRLARLVDQQLGVPVRAVAAWQAVLRAEPFDAEALEALERLYTQEEDWPALINTGCAAASTRAARRTRPTCSASSATCSRPSRRIRRGRWSCTGRSSGTTRPTRWRCLRWSGSRGIWTTGGWRPRSWSRCTATQGSGRSSRC
ncbi:MAG: hypothetical protein R3F43_08035 [bacterium]